MKDYVVTSVQTYMLFLNWFFSKLLFWRIVSFWRDQSHIHAVHANPYTAKHKVGSGIEPIQTCPHFVTRTSCCGEATRTSWPLPHEMLNSECIPQTFSLHAELHFQLHNAATRCEYRGRELWMNKLFAAHLRLEAKVHLKNGVQRRVWWQLASLAARNRLLCLTNIALDLDIIMMLAVI